MARSRVVWRTVGLVLILAIGAGLLWARWRASARAANPEARLLSWRGAERRDVTAADVKDLVGARGLEVVRTADRVEFFKLRIDQYGAEPPEIDRQLSGTPAQLSHARDELLAADIYSYTQRGGHKRCGGFQPRDAVRFWRGKESVVFLICFTCADVAVVTHDADGDASPFIIADVQPGRSRLRDLMEGVFPGTVPAAH